MAKNLASVLAHDSVADAQAQTGSLAHFLGGEERVENAIGVGDAVTVVAKCNLDQAVRDWRS